MTDKRDGRGATGITRRQFNATSASAVALMATGAGRAAFADTPQRGGHMRVGMVGQNSGASLDPATWGNSAINSQGIWPGVYSNLTEIAPDGQLEGTLAESFEASSDAKTWTFTLREGVEFHNGKTLDGNDVAASLNHHRGESSASAAKGLVEGITDITVDGRNVVITLAEGNADFAYLMSDYHLPIGIGADGMVDWQAGIGTGGYTIDNLNYGVRLDLERNPNYWRDDRAFFDSIELIEVSDTTSMMNGIATGEFDLIDRIDLRAKALLERAGNIVVEETTGTQHFTFPMFTNTGPFDDVNVRLAMKLAINREDLVERILLGHGRVANDHPIAPPNQFFASDLEQRAYDPERARWHLAQAGHDRLAVDLHVSDSAFPGAVDAAVLFQEHAQAGGIDINVVREPTDGYWSNVWMVKPFCASYWGGRPTEDWMFSTVYASGAPWNDTFWENDRFNVLLGEARVTLDTNLRREMYTEMQSLVRDDGGTIVPMYANYVWARSNRLTHGPQVASNWTVDGWKAIERWWFA